MPKTRRSLKEQIFDAHAVVLEDINSKIDGVVEGYKALEERITRLELIVNKLVSDMDIVKTELHA